MIPVFVPWKSRGLALLTVIGVLWASSVALAEDKDKGFKNLKVLPKDISEDQLHEYMRKFTSALGVRCAYCHVGEESKPFSEWDFAADTKAPKQTARLMMQMTGDLNEKWVAQVKSDRPAPTRVGCATCHHGKPVPRSLQDVLGETVAEKGAAAAVAQYREMREKYYGRDAYDFGEPPLNTLAQQLSKDKKTADAITLLELNAEFNPKSARVQGMLGGAYLDSGDKPKAITAYRKAVELNPDFEPAKRKLAELEKGVTK